jgi:hypothetical protein
MKELINQFIENSGIQTVEVGANKFYVADEKTLDMFSRFLVSECTSTIHDIYTSRFDLGKLRGEGLDMAWYSIRDKFNMHKWSKEFT